MSRFWMVVVAAVVAAAPALAQATHGIDRADLDTTCAPCTDFYQFATGGWRARNPIPKEYPEWGAFQALQEHNRDVLHEILDQTVADTANAANANLRKLGVFYATCMDSSAADSEHLQPLEDQLRQIDAVTTAASIRDEIARLQEEGVDVGFGFAVNQDRKQSTVEVLYVAQGGIGLPDRDYYTKTDSTSARIRSEYAAHVGRLLALSGTAPALARGEADSIVQLETALAYASMTRVERRDPYNTYHKMTVAGADSLAPHLEVRAWLTDLQVPPPADIIVSQPRFLSAVDSLLTHEPISVWRAYLRWHLLDITAPWLDSTFVNEDFQMRKVLTGVPAMQPRWRRCVQATDRALGEALGQAYVARAFSPEAKQRALDLVHNLEETLKNDLATLSWMTPATRQAAIVKLAAFSNKIGYPDKWRDYSSLTVEHRPFVLNFLDANAFEIRRRLKKLGHPVDRTEFTMSPPTVNAYYNGSMNEIVFPAGILQPPFFDPKADDASNYGGIGYVIGHEMTHGFDDQGRKFDAQGNLRDWWTPEDAKAYNERSSLVADQYSGYVAVDSVHLNGRLTLGENTADIGGLKLAYLAMEKAYANKPRDTIAGFTPEQRFFIAVGQIWRENVRPMYARQLAITDPHSPGRWRIDGPLSDMPEFAKAFGCKQGDPMVRPDSLRPQIW
jgi:putative endopeptidase